MRSWCLISVRFLWISPQSLSWMSVGGRHGCPLGVVTHRYRLDGHLTADLHAGPGPVWYWESQWIDHPFCWLFDFWWMLSFRKYASTQCGCIRDSKWMMKGNSRRQQVICKAVVYRECIVQNGMCRGIGNQKQFIVQCIECIVGVFPSIYMPSLDVCWVRGYKEINYCHWMCRCVCDEPKWIKSESELRCYLQSNLYEWI